MHVKGMTFHTLMFMGNIVRLWKANCFWSDTAANYPQIKTWLVKYLVRTQRINSWEVLHNSSRDSEAGRKSESSRK